MTTFYSFSITTGASVSSQTFKYSDGKLTSCSPYCQTKVPWSNGSLMLFLRSEMPSIPPHQDMNLPFLLCNYLLCSVHFSLHLPISKFGIRLRADVAFCSFSHHDHVTFFIYIFFFLLFFCFIFFYIFYIHIFWKRNKTK